MKSSLIAKIKKLYHDYYSLIFIPDNGRPFFEVKLRKLYLIIFLIAVVSSATYSIILTNITTLSYTTLTSKEIHADKLETSTNNQIQHIQKLEQEIDHINAKINTLDSLEVSIRNIVGLSEQPVSMEVSRSSGRRSEFNKEQMDLTNQANNINEVKNINIKLDSKIEEMNTLIKEVEECLKYLEAYPDRWPTWGRITSGYGWRIHPIYRKSDFHTGIDIANSYKTPIYASGAGKVIFSGYKNGYGRTVIIDHGYGYKTVYGHNSVLLVDKGDWVEKGEQIAKMGSTGTSTGNHCHFEVIQNGSTINPYETLK